LRSPQKQKVLSLGPNWGNIIVSGPDGILYIRDASKIFHIYKPNKNGIYPVSDTTTFPGAPWDLSMKFVTINDTTAMVANTSPYGLFRFVVNQNTHLLTPAPTVNPSDPHPDNFGFFYGNGWNRYEIIPHGKFVFLFDHKNNVLLRTPTSVFIDPWSSWNMTNWLNNPNPPDYTRKKVKTGTDFGVYKEVLSFSNGLIAWKKDGTLWYYPVATNGTVGDKNKIGAGWNKYVKLIISGDDILALDSNGNLYRFKDINTNGFYQLQ
jgi:hypothetical protein